MNKVIVNTYINKATQTRRCIDSMRDEWSHASDKNTYLNFPQPTSAEIDDFRHHHPLSVEKYQAEFMEFSTWGDDGETSPCVILRTSDGQIHVEDATCIVFTGE